jgi:hypothetical protein
MKKLVEDERDTGRLHHYRCTTCGLEWDGAKDSKCADDMLHDFPAILALQQAYRVERAAYQRLLDARNVPYSRDDSPAIRYALAEWHETLDLRAQAGGTPAAIRTMLRLRG